MLEIQHSPGPPNPLEIADPETIELDAKKFNFIHFEDTIFNRFTKLETLNLSECSIYSLPQSLFTIKTLKNLDISKNYIKEVPCELGYLPSIEKLNILYNPFCKFLVDKGYDPEKIDIIPVFKKICMKHIRPQKRKLYPNINVNQRNTFMILSYNILAPYTVRPDRFPLCLKKYLSTEYRISLIKNQISDYPPSIVCFQEVEGRVFRELETYMRDRGFLSTYSPKGRVEEYTGDHKDLVHGEATFVRSNVFQIVDTQSLQYRNHPKAKALPIYEALQKHDETAAITILKPLRGIKNFFIAVVNVHLYWEQGPLADEIRFWQLYLALDTVNSLITKHTSLFDIIVAGDFNSAANTKPVDFLKTKMVDVYSFLNVRTPFTIYAPTVCDTIDYIFSTQKYIKPMAVLLPTDENEIKDAYVGFPADFYPSDHLPLAAYFEIPKKQNHQIAEPAAKIQVDKPEKKPCKIAVSSEKKIPIKRDTPEKIVLTVNKKV